MQHVQFEQTAKKSPISEKRKKILNGRRICRKKKTAVVTNKQEKQNEYRTQIHNCAKKKKIKIKKIKKKKKKLKKN